MRVEKIGTEERLIIQSEDGNLEIVLLGLIIIAPGFAVLLLIELAEHGFNGMFWMWVIILLILLVIPLETWIATGRKIIMDREGCIVLLGYYQKCYQWNELIVKKYVKGPYQLEDCIRGFEQSYSEGIVFSTHRAKCLRWMRPFSYCTYIRPLSSFFVNFYPLGIGEGHGDHKSQMEAYKVRTGKQPFFTPAGITRRPEVYPADKIQFLQYMDRWHVEIEGLTKAARLHLD